MLALRSVLLALAASAIGCDGAGAPDAGVPRAEEFRSERVEAMLEGASRVVRTRGFASEGVSWPGLAEGADVWRGFLLEQGSEVRAIAMRSGSCYVVVAVGSSALRELDLRVFDGDGAEVARDAEPGPAAALRFCPAQSGGYFVAPRAAAGSGLFAVRAFRGPAGLEWSVSDAVRGLGAERSE